MENEGRPLLPSPPYSLPSFYYSVQSLIFAYFSIVTGFVVEEATSEFSTKNKIVVMLWLVQHVFEQWVVWIGRMIGTSNRAGQQIRGRVPGAGHSFFREQKTRFAFFASNCLQKMLRSRSSTK